MSESLRVTLDDGGCGVRRGAVQLAVGQVLHRYRIDEVLGAGGMGMVVRARDLDLERDVALKVAITASDPERDQRRAAMLLREARAMARLRARHVRAVHDIGSADGIDYIAMEYVAGVDLARWLATPRSLREIARVFVAAARGLAAAHAAGVVHRDFKPSNVLVSDDGDVVVTDFGLSRWLHERSPRDTAGTPRYLAPDADPADPRGDQYSFCVALGEAIGAARPGDPAGLRQRLALVARHGTAAVAADRYPSMTAVIAALERAIRRPRWPLAVAALLIATAALAAGRARIDRSPGTSAPAPPIADRIAALERWPIDRALDRTRALIDRGYLRSARELAGAALTGAAIVAPARQAALLYEIGYAAIVAEDTPAARQALEAAAQLADEGRDDPLRARALLGLLLLATSRGSDLEQAERAERSAAAALARVEPTRAERALLRTLQGVIAHRHGRVAEFQRAVAEARQLVTPPRRDDLLIWGEILRSQAGVALAAGDRDTAVTVLRELIATVDRIAGRDHLAAIGGRGQLARVLEATGRDREAGAVMTELRAIGRTAAGARLLAEIVPLPRSHSRPVRVTVRSPSGAPVDRATVLAATAFHANSLQLLGASSLYDERARNIQMVTSDAHGAVVLALDDRGGPWIAAEHPELGRSAAVPAPSGDALELTLSPWGRLAGTAPHGAAIYLVPARRGDAPPIVLHPGADGRFASERIPQGPYVVAICRGRDAARIAHKRCSARPLAVSSRSIELALTLATGTGRLTVRPRDELARSIESSQVVLLPGDRAPSDLRALAMGWADVAAARPGSVIEWMSVHDGGQAQFRDLPAGRYTLCATGIHGDTADPAFASRLAARAAPVPLFCTPITIGATAVEVDLAIPAARRVWLGAAADDRGAPGAQISALPLDD